MTIFNYKIINYKKFVASMALFAILISSVSFLIQKPSIADAAVTDCTTVSGNLIQNCSFEDPATLPAGYTTDFFGYPTFFSAYTGFTGWNFITPGTGNVTLATGGTNFPQGTRAFDISGVIDPLKSLNGEIYGSGISQIVSGLTIGQQYTLSFYQTHFTLLGTTYPSQVKVVVDGNSLGSFNHTTTTAGDSINGQIWTKNSVTFTASGTSATIQLLNDVPTPAPADGASRPVDLIDNVVLTLAPDTIPPTLSITAPSNGAVVSGAFTVTVCTSEPLATTPVAATLELTDFNVTNGTASGLSGPTTGPTCPGGEIYTVTITPTIVVDGTITVSIPSGAATDPAGNSSTTANSVTATYDVVTVIISPVHIQTDNGTNNQYGTTGNTVTLTYTTDIDVSTAGTHTVTIGGQSVVPSCTGAGPSICTATLPITAIVPASDGLLSFSIVVDSQTTTATTDGSSVTVDRTINVVINTPVPGDDLSTFLIGGQCEIGAGNVTLSGSGFSPSPVTTPCDAFGYFEYEPVTGTPGTITITATQTDLAGNVGTDTNVYILAVPTLPVVTISGPLGNASTGSNTITGTCTTSAGNVTISGTGFTPSPGTAICVGGIYSYPITVTGNTTFTASQTNGAGTAIATGSTIVPTTTTSGGGGCLPGYSCFSNTPSTPTNSSSVVITNTTTPVVSTDTNRCPAFTQYLKKGMRDGRNGVSEISKVQSFLNGKLGLNLTVDGIFGSRTHSAVRNFQTTYSSQILNLWSLTGPTGWWYQSTRSYANYLEDCSEGTVRLDNGIQIRDGSIQ